MIVAVVASAVAVAMTIAAVMAIITAVVSTIISAVVTAIHAWGRAVAIRVDEVNRLTTGVVVVAVAAPVLVVAGRHTHVNGTLLNRDRAAVDDDRLRVDDGRGRLVADVDAAIEPWLVDRDADAYVGCSETAGGCEQTGQGQHTMAGQTQTGSKAVRRG